MIYLIRHGQSAFNAAYSGGDDPMIWDAGLTAKGMTQAMMAAEAAMDLRLELIITSPLTRALQTTELMFEGQLPVAVVPGIRERQDHSCDIGRAPSILANEFPNFDFSHLEDIWWHQGPLNPDGVAMEPVDLFHTRVNETIAEIADQEAERIGVVCHGNVIKALTGHQPDNCEIVTYST